MSKDLIVKRLKIISEIEKEVNKLKENLQSSLESDAEYQKIEEEVNKVRNQHKERTQKILSNPVVKSLKDQLAEKRTEIKENKEILSIELVDYYRESGLPEFEDVDGNIKKMKFTVKLVN